MLCATRKAGDEPHRRLSLCWKYQPAKIPLDLVFNFDGTGLVSSGRPVLQALQREVAGTQGKTAQADWRQQQASRGMHVTRHEGCPALARTLDTELHSYAATDDTTFPTTPAAFRVQCDRMQGLWSHGTILEKGVCFRKQG